MIVVTGATGRIGGHLARLLHGQGRPVRALVRDPARATGLPAGVERAVGHLDRPETLAAALAGVDRVFHMQASHGTGQTQTMVDAARRAGVRHIVALSSISACGVSKVSQGLWAAVMRRGRTR